MELKYKNKIYTIKEAYYDFVKSNITISTFRSRLQRLPNEYTDRQVEQCFKPVNPKRGGRKSFVFKYKGKEYTLEEFLKDFNSKVSPETFKRRLVANGMQDPESLIKKHKSKRRKKSESSFSNINTAMLW